MSGNQTCTCRCETWKAKASLVMTSFLLTWLTSVASVYCIAYFQPGLFPCGMAYSTQADLTEIKASSDSDLWKEKKISAGIYTDMAERMYDIEEEHVVVLHRTPRSSSRESRRRRTRRPDNAPKISHFYLRPSLHLVNSDLIWEAAPWSTGHGVWNASLASVVVTKRGYYALYAQMTLLVNGSASGFVVEKTDEWAQTSRVLRYVETLPLNFTGARMLRTCSAQTILPMDVGERLNMRLEFPTVVKHERESTFWGLQFLGGIR